MKTELNTSLRKGLIYQRIVDQIKATDVLNGIEPSWEEKIDQDSSSCVCKY
jgi:hypothetical protein